MQYELLSSEQANVIRGRFETAFLKSMEQYAKSNPYFSQYPKYEVCYSARFKENFERLDFYSALGELTKKNSTLYFLSDIGNGLGSKLNNDFVATTNNSKAFAKQLFDEWCREFYIGNYMYSEVFHETTNGLFKDSVFINLLPYDVYIFDDGMDWMIAFTHEDCEDESEYNEDEGCIAPCRCCYLIQNI